MLLIDFGETHVFESATVMTNILLFANAQNSNNLLATQVKEDFSDPNMIASYVAKNKLNCHFDGTENWVIMPDEIRNIKKRVEIQGKPLEMWDIVINRGILTGFNKAFIIDKETRDAILDNCVTEEERTRTANLIRPILRGKDVRKYGNSWYKKGMYLINSHNGVKGKFKRIDIDEYPSVKNFMDRYIDKLSKRYDKGETPYNLRNCAYIEEFDKPKIIYPNMTKFMPFYYDEHKFFTNQKCYIITGEHISFLTAFFNSSLFKFCFFDNFPVLFGGSRELSKIFFDKIPVIEVSDEINDEFRELVLDIQNEYSVEKARAIDQRIFDLYNLSKDERENIGYIDFQSNDDSDEDDED